MGGTIVPLSFFEAVLLSPILFWLRDEFRPWVARLPLRTAPKKQGREGSTAHKVRGEKAPLHTKLHHTQGGRGDGVNNTSPNEGGTQLHLGGAAFPSSFWVALLSPTPFGNRCCLPVIKIDMIKVIEKLDKKKKQKGELGFWVLFLGSPSWLMHLKICIRDFVTTSIQKPPNTPTSALHPPRHIVLRIRRS